MSKALSSGMRCFIAFAFTVAGVGNHAHAFKFDDGPIEGNIDTTLSFGISSRMDDADEDLPRGGHARHLGGESVRLARSRQDVEPLVHAREPGADHWPGS